MYRWRTRSRKITIWKEGWISFNLKYLWNSQTNSSTLRTHSNNIQTLHLLQNLKKLKQFSLLIIRQKKRLCEIEKFIIISISQTKLSINLQLIHRAILEKIRFKKKVIKILTSNISEIYGPIILPKELDQEPSKIYLHKEFWRD